MKTTTNAKESYQVKVSGGKIVTWHNDRMIPDAVGEAILIPAGPEGHTSRLLWCKLEAAHRQIDQLHAEIDRIRNIKASR